MFSCRTRRFSVTLTLQSDVFKTSPDDVTRLMSPSVQTDFSIVFFRNRPPQSHLLLSPVEVSLIGG